MWFSVNLYYSRERNAGSAWCLIRECNYHESAHTPSSKGARDAATEIRVVVQVGSLL